MNSNTSRDDSIERPNTSPDFETLEEKASWLTDRAQWLYWNASADKPRKPLKTPTSTSGASWTSPDTWSDYSDAKAASKEVEKAGIGYVFMSDEDMGTYGGLDLDGCLEWEGDRPKPKDWLPSLRPFIERGAYIEISPSGDGLHIPIKRFDEPDWWSDVHSSEEEHEGVEAYGKKFFTVTGDLLAHYTPGGADVGDDAPEDGDWLDEWLREAYKSVTGKDPVTAERPDYSEGSDRERQGEYLTESDISEALNHIDPDVSYETWRDIGFALTDFFAKATAEKLFNQWSQSGSKWDSTAERSASRIIDDGGAGDCTIGTVIHYAKQGGWEMPAPPETSGSTNTRYSNGIQKRPGDGYYKESGEREDGSTVWQAISNFTLSVESRRKYAAEERELREYELTVDPRNEPSFIVTVDTSAFNNTREFKDSVVTGFGTWFDGASSDVNAIRNMLAAEDVPVREVVDHIGPHGGTFVTPVGTFDEDGWLNRDTYAIDDDNNLAESWNITRAENDEIDEQEVAEILRLLPKTRLRNRGVPAIAWFYTAPFRSMIKNIEGQFNNFHLTGDAGSGKSAFIRMSSSLFGISEVGEASATNFIIERTLSSTDTVPVALDEYKPSNLPKHKVDALHEYLRKLTDDQPVQKGTQSLGYRYLHLEAPVCVCGEQPIQGAAEQRRAIISTFSKEPTRQGTTYREAFAKLDGLRVGEETYEQADYSQHASAFYRWMLAQDENELIELWHECARDADDILERLDVTRIDNAKRAGYAVVLFGTEIYQQFAAQYGVKPDEHGMTRDAAESAIEYLATEGDGADRESHLEEYLGVSGRAISAGYMTENEHYTFVNKGKPNEAIALRKDYAFDAVSRYARDHDLSGVDLFDSYSDYRSRISDSADDPDSPVVEYSKTVRLGKDTARCDTFNPGALGFFDSGDIQESKQKQENENIESESDIGALEPGFASFTAEAVSASKPKPWQAGRGILMDDEGIPIDYVIEVPEKGVADVELKQGTTYSFSMARVGEDQNGVKIVRIIPETTEITVEPEEPEDEQSMNAGVDETEQTATDGGEELPQVERIQTVIDALGGHDEVTVSQLVNELSMPPETIGNTLDNLAKNGDIIRETNANGNEVFRICA